MIRLVKVTKVYGRETPAIRSSPKEVKGVVALRGVNLHVPRGEFCVLLGRSGSGKSTLLNLIGGLDTPTSGEVYVDGQNLAHLSEVQLTQLRRDKIGFIFQFFNLLPLLTVRENVALPALLRGETWQEVASRVEEL
ncbi:MAG TPA: ATP-binding cassette domain-containing protein, partial [Armatimonadetes bacterium]|nr:ATP-binding cassette domain-containing protein [Armatimonadota bacterium]